MFLYTACSCNAYTAVCELLLSACCTFVKIVFCQELFPRACIWIVGCASYWRNHPSKSAESSSINCLASSGWITEASSGSLFASIKAPISVIMTKGYAEQAARTRSIHRRMPPSCDGCDSRTNRSDGLQTFHRRRRCSLLLAKLTLLCGHIAKVSIRRKRRYVEWTWSKSGLCDRPAHCKLPLYVVGSCHGRIFFSWLIGNFPWLGSLDPYRSCRYLGTVLFGQEVLLPLAHANRVWPHTCFV